MRTKQEAIQYCYSFENVYEDYPFHDDNWCVMRHRENKKTFALIYDKDGFVWINVKCDPEWRDFWRNTFSSVIPAYHMNKAHWNSIILDESVPEQDIRRMIGESYDLTKENVSRSGVCPVVSIVEQTAKKKHHQKEQKKKNLKYY